MSDEMLVVSMTMMMLILMMILMMMMHPLPHLRRVRIRGGLRPCRASV